ncbi:hypothetical protein E3N88_29238 [Mikania micrantha]|uniref:Uncharacterized protein n=1 Tax=Mikania micrantha TaxID=192012 RepID=A0A5N6MI94_9ASTR|nr:hypothetical protein E3N88_29238 [Mikania micrantha]
MVEVLSCQLRMPTFLKCLELRYPRRRKRRVSQYYTGKEENGTLTFRKTLRRGATLKMPRMAVFMGITAKLSQNPSFGYLGSRVEIGRKSKVDQQKSYYGKSQSEGRDFLNEDSYSTPTGAELLTFLGLSLRQGVALLFPLAPSCIAVEFFASRFGYPSSFPICLK